ALVGEVNDEPGVEERELAQTAREDVEAELGVREDERIGLEGELGARLVRLADGAEGLTWNAPIVLLEPDPALPTDLEAEPLSDGVDGADADAVEAGGHLVARVVELAAGVEDGHDQLRRAHALGVHSHRDPAAVILDRDRAVEMDGDPDL